MKARIHHIHLLPLIETHQTIVGPIGLLHTKETIWGFNDLVIKTQLLAAGEDGKGVEVGST